jgi:aspartate-semialdehyde dehydrogenase
MGTEQAGTLQTPAGGLPLPQRLAGRCNWNGMQCAASAAARQCKSLLKQQQQAGTQDLCLPCTSSKPLQQRGIAEPGADRDLCYCVAPLSCSFDGVDIALFSAGGSISKKLGPAAQKAGAVVSALGGGAAQRQQL